MTTAKHHALRALQPGPRRRNRFLTLSGLLPGLLCLEAIAGTAGLVNGEFAVDLNGWTLAGPPFPAWSMLDHENNGLSGSAALINDSTSAGVRLYPLRQCLHLPQAGSYRIETEGLLPAGHASGRLVVSLSSHAAADCSGGTNSALGYFVGSDGNWQHGTATFSIEAGFNYLDLSLGIEKDAEGGLLSGNIDAVRVIYREPIFADGFDGGDLP